MEERLPPACAFAISVLAERDLDPENVPEEAVEAAQQHLITCTRCNKEAATPTANSTPPKRKKGRRGASADYSSQFPSQMQLAETPSLVTDTQAKAKKSGSQPKAVSTLDAPSTMLPVPITATSETSDVVTVMTDAQIDCQQCRQMLPEYADAIDSGQNVATLYPDIQMHLLTCESGCLVLLELFTQEAKATRKYRRHPVRDPFSAIGWQLSGFFRGGQVPMSPTALAYGTLILLVLVASLSAYLGINWNEARYHSAPTHLVATPDGIGLSDGLKVYDACNSASYGFKRDAAQTIQDQNPSTANSLLTSAVNALQSDTTGCNSAEAGIYRENLHIRQSGRPYGIVVVSFDSGPGNADPTGGTDRHMLYAASTQELVGALIAQQQYNQAQMQIPGAPLLYLVLANTTGTALGTLQVTNTIAAIAQATDLHQFGLLASGTRPLLAVLGLGPSNLIQVALPIMCHAGIPLIAPTATGPFVTNLLTQTSLYRHCSPGFAFIRSSPDDAQQSSQGANYAYNRLNVHDAAIFYDPSDSSSNGSAQSFRDTFSRFAHARIVAQETFVTSGLLDANGHSQASQESVLAGFKDALQAKSHPNLIFAALPTDEVMLLAQTIAQLPQGQQPILMVGGNSAQPAVWQGLVQWTRQKQALLPHVFVVLSSAARAPTGDDWQKQFYASFCTSFTTQGHSCSSTAALDQGALLFADGIEMIAKSMSPINTNNSFPTMKELVRRISTERFAGVSCSIALHQQENGLITSTSAQPVILGVQEDGSLQIVG